MAEIEKNTLSKDFKALIEGAKKGTTNPGEVVSAALAVFSASVITRRDPTEKDFLSEVYED